MKKTIYSIAVVGVIGLASCSGSLEDSLTESMEEAVEKAEEALEEETSENSIAGVWELTDLEMSLEMEIPADKKAEMEKARKEIIESNSNISFNEDGTYTENMFQAGLMVANEGTYVVDGDEVILTESGGMERRRTIDTQTDSELVLTEGAMGMSSTMTYKRS